MSNNPHERLVDPNPHTNLWRSRVIKIKFTGIERLGTNYTLSCGHVQQWGGYYGMRIPPLKVNDEVTCQSCRRKLQYPPKPEGFER